MVSAARETRKTSINSRHAFPIGGARWRSEESRGAKGRRAVTRGVTLGRLQRPFPKGFSPGLPRPGYKAPARASLEAVSTAFFLKPAGVYAGRLPLRIFYAFQSVI